MNVAKYELFTVQACQSVDSTHNTNNSQNYNSMCTYGGFVLGVLELLLEVEGEDGLHAVVGEPLAELVTHDEEDALRVGQLLKT